MLVAIMCLLLLLGPVHPLSLGVSRPKGLARRSWFRDQQNFPEERLFPDGGRRSATGGGFGSASGVSPKAKSGKGGKAVKKGGKAAKKR